MKDMIPIFNQDLKVNLPFYFFCLSFGQKKFKMSMETPDKLLILPFKVRGRDILSQNLPQYSY